MTKEEKERKVIYKEKSVVLPKPNEEYLLALLKSPNVAEWHIFAQGNGMYFYDKKTSSLTNALNGEKHQLEEILKGYNKKKPVVTPTN